MLTSIDDFVSRLIDLYNVGDTGWLLLSIVLLTGALILFRAFKSWSTVLQLVGAVANFLYNVGSTFLGYMAFYGLTHPGSRLAYIVYPTDTPDPRIQNAMSVLHIIAILFPIGFLCCAIVYPRQVTA